MIFFTELLPEEFTNLFTKLESYSFEYQLRGVYKMGGFKDEFYKQIYNVVFLKKNHFFFFLKT